MSRLGGVEFEIWASDSGNRLFATPDLAAALSWALAYWTREGDTALDALSVGDERDQWVVSGDELRSLLRRQMWQAPAPLVTSAHDRVQGWGFALRPQLAG
jgi:hypothetical protein